MNELYRKNFLQLVSILDKIMLTVAGSAIATLVIQYGFYIDVWTEKILQIFNSLILFVFIFNNFARLIVSRKPLAYFKAKWLELVLSFLVLAQNIGFFFFISNNIVDVSTLTRIYITTAQVYIVTDILVKTMRYSRTLVQRSLHPARVLVLSFFLLIVFGTSLLLLPRATYRGISFIDALFTATSAVCVTGLTVVDTGTYFTRLGQLIILTLIQLGGLGIMTFTTFFAVLLGGGVGIKERIFLSEIFSERNYAKITSTALKILVMSFAIESIGFIALYLLLPDSMFRSEEEKIFIAVFHSVSAFCNAGFSTFSKNLVEIKQNIPALFVIAMLFILGGLGFMVLSEYFFKPFLIVLHRIKFLRDKIRLEQLSFSLHSKLTLTTTLVLITFGTIVFLILEYDGVLRDENFIGKIFHSFFQAVTPRTAGFNTLDIGKVGTATALFMMLLMWIGASPGSTGGGIKTTSFAIIFLKIYATITGKNRVEVFNREVDEQTVVRAFSSAMLSILLISSASFFLILTEKTLNLIDIVFESVSAFGTVGLSRGITSSLSVAGKLIITFLMFVGRVGVLAFAFALAGRIERRNYEFPKENVLVT